MREKTPYVNGLECLKDYSWDSPRLSILVRVMNEMQALPEFWARLKRQTISSECEFVFLDSGSCDGSLDFLMRLPARVFRICPEAFSFGRSCNQLMEASTAPLVCFLSAHVFLEKDDALEQAQSVLKNLKFAAAYLRQVPNPVLGFSTYERVQLRRRFPAGGKVISLNRPNGFSNAASLLTRAAWLRHRFPDVHGSEDFLWAEAHLRDGGLIYYLPFIAALHSHDESAAQLRTRVALNLHARGGGRAVTRGILYLAGVFTTLINAGASPREAWNYALAHAQAYWSCGRAPAKEYRKGTALPQG